MNQRSMWQSGIVLAAVALLLGSQPGAYAATDTWNGSADVNWGNVSNWTSAVPGSADTALFNIAAPGSPITLDVPRSVTSITFDTSVGSFSIGAVGGTNALTLTSGGTIALGTTATSVTGSNGGETFNAPLVLAGTAYTITNKSTTASDLLNFTGSITGTTGASTLTLGGTTTGGVNTISGAIGNGGATSLAVAVGSGKWALSGNNTMSGGVTVSINSTLDIMSANALGTGVFKLNNGSTFDNTGTGPITLAGISGVTIANAFTFQGTNDLNLGSAAVTVTGAGIWTINGGSLIMGGPISGSVAVTKAGTGTLVLGGATGSSFTGSLTLTGGAIDLNNAAALGTGSFNLTSGTIDNTSGSAITLSTTGNETWGAFTFGGTNDLNLNSAAVALNSGGATVTINNSGTLTVGGVVSGGNALTKNGTGTLVLNGANTYTGGTVVNAGTLIVGGTGVIGAGGETLNGGTLLVNAGGSIAGTATVNSGNLIVNGSAATVTVKAGTGNTAFLGGNGTFSGGVGIGGGAGTSIINAGGVNAIGAMTFVGALSASSNTLFEFELNSNNGTIDSYSVGGRLALGAGIATLQGTDLGSATLTLGTVLTLATYGTMTGSGFLGLANGADVTIGQNIFQINYGALTSASAITLTDVGAVPEPSTWALLGFGAFGLFAVARRRAA